MADQEDAESSNDIEYIYIEKVRRLVAEVLDLPLEAKTLFYEQLLISDPRSKNQEAATKAGLPQSCHVDVLYNDFALSATWSPAGVLKLLEGFYLAESIVMVGGGEFDFEVENVASRDDYVMAQVIPVIKAEDVRIPIAQLPEVLAENPSVPKDILVNAEKFVVPSERHFRFHMADKLRTCNDSALF